MTGQDEGRGSWLTRGEEAVIFSFYTHTKVFYVSSSESVIPIPVDVTMAVIM